MKMINKNKVARQIKVLPQIEGVGVPPGNDTVVQPKMWSRQYPVKGMFTAVVTNLIPSLNFNSKIHRTYQ